MKIKSWKPPILIALTFLFYFTGNIAFAGGGADREATELGITSQILKEHWTAGTGDSFEGIYIQYEGNNPYLLGVLKTNTLNILYQDENLDEDEYGDIYTVVYLDGPDSRTWQEGRLKAFFFPNGESGRDFRGYWYLSSGRGSINTEVYFFDDDSSFRIRIPGTGLFSRDQINIYEKIFPFSHDFARQDGVEGTGFLLNREGYVVTNYHVIEGTRHILVRGINGNFERAYPYSAELIDEENDIAILKPEVSFIRPNSQPPYGFTTAEIPIGSSVFALGFPLRGLISEEITLTSGIISSLSGAFGNPNAYQMTTPINPGNSGGPLFNEQGNVIGINTSRLEPAFISSVNYAIKIRYVLDLIRNSGLRINTPPNSTSIWTRNLVENTQRVRNFVYMIEAF